MTIYPNVGALKIAATERTALAASNLRLFKGTAFIPSVSTTLADLTPIECDFSGYPAGGAPIANFQNPLLAPGGGASIDSGLVQFAWVAPVPPAEPVGNLVGGWFLVDSAGVLVAVGTFPNGISVSMAGQGIPMNVGLVFGRSAA